MALDVFSLLVDKKLNIFDLFQIRGGKDEHDSSAVTNTTVLPNALEVTDTTSKTECLIEEDCLPKEVKENAKEYVKNETGLHIADDLKAVEEALKISSCNAESCLVKTLVVKNGLSKETARETASKLKPPGPKLSTRWLDNFNIDKTLDAWETEFPGFFPYSFQMMDFAKVQLPSFNGETRKNLAEIPVSSIIDKGYTQCACVLNTDTSSGPGKHWVCVFVDTKIPEKWTVEYFNSSGNRPTKQVTEWASKTVADLQKKNPNTKFVFYNQMHQMSRSECGVYCLYYIRSRLKGTPVETFENQRIADEDMVEFRTHLFSEVNLQSI